jgi:hypothetical protein
MAPSCPSTPQPAAPPSKADSTQISNPSKKYSTLEGQYHKLSLTGPNHYKGDMVYANFGYVLIDGQWVDPESEGDLYNAYMGVSDDSHLDLDVPELHRSRDFGPHILTLEEQNEFYREYVKDVTDEADGEGDPRALHITPATFARWAKGAVKVDAYVEVVVEPPVRTKPSFINHTNPSLLCETSPNSLKLILRLIGTHVQSEAK